MAKLYVGLDVSRAKTALCIVNAVGKVLMEAEVESTPTAIAEALRPYRRLLAKVGHETGLYTPFLHKELLRRRIPAICLDARNTRAALAGQRNKTDRNDARDMARALARGFNHIAYVKSDEAHRIRMLLSCRKALQRKARDLEAVLSTTLRALGWRLAKTGKRYSLQKPRRQEDAFVSGLSDRMLRARMALSKEVKDLDQIVADLANTDPICRRLMTAPGVGPITALAVGRREKLPPQRH